MLFLADDERRDLGGPTQLSLQQKLETVTVKQLFLKHSFTTPVTAATSVVLTSQMLARQGVGAGNMLIKVVHRPSSKISLEVSHLVNSNSLNRQTAWDHPSASSCLLPQGHLLPRL